MHPPFNLRRVRCAALAAGAIALALTPIERASAAFTFKRLHSFCSSTGCDDGSLPQAGLIIDGNGVLYGTASQDGKNSYGVVFDLVPNSDKSRYTEHVLHNFCPNTNCPDGATPAAGLIMDVDGNLYGTASQGGNTTNTGVVFKLTHGSKGWSLGTLHKFCNDQSCSDGETPLAGLSYAGQNNGQVWDKSSPLFGTTDAGGAYANGVAFELKLSGSSWTYTVIHNFQSSANPNEVVADSAGNIYGTTQTGGKYDGGLMYKLASGTWSETALHIFCSSSGCKDGDHPAGRLWIDKSSNLFGTTYSGGGGSCLYGCGVLFERPSGGTYKVIHVFSGSGDGVNPDAGVIGDGSGNLFGTTFGCCQGVFSGDVFEFSGGTLSQLHVFCSQSNCADGANPEAPVIFGTSGEILGTTYYGGPHGAGTVFRLGSTH